MGPRETVLYVQTLWCNNLHFDEFPKKELPRRYKSSTNFNDILIKSSKSVYHTLSFQGSAVDDPPLQISEHETTDPHNIEVYQKLNGESILYQRVPLTTVVLQKQSTVTRTPTYSTLSSQSVNYLSVPNLQLFGQEKFLNSLIIDNLDNHYDIQIHDSKKSLGTYTTENNVSHSLYKCVVKKANMNMLTIITPRIFVREQEMNDRLKLEHTGNVQLFGPEIAVKHREKFPSEIANENNSMKNKIKKTKGTVDMGKSSDRMKKFMNRSNSEGYRRKYQDHANKQSDLAYSWMEEILST